MTKIFKPLIIISLLLQVSIAEAASLENAMEQSAAGMKTQGERMKIISENIANETSTGPTPGSEPYRRKTIYFKNKPNKATGSEIVTVNKVSRDYKTELGKKFDPANPAADDNGYVLLPNVSTPIEQLDMKEAQRSYEANLGAMSTSKRMYLSTIDLLK
jgi:flagellar basal-body rod protein FlgC